MSYKDEGLIRQLARDERERCHYRRLIMQRKRHGDRDRRKEEEQKRLSSDVATDEKV